MKEITLTLTPAEASDSSVVKSISAESCGIPLEEIRAIRYLQRSVDARRGRILINLKVEVWTEDIPPAVLKPEFEWKSVAGAQEVIIIGSGPAGLFAALALIEQGVKPVILERGKEISERKIDVARINRGHLVDPDSNYCFGEGGAGTFSDGKLYTRSKKRGDNLKVLELLVAHGANPDILFESHPHIGTDKLPSVITNIRKTILASGGEILFGHRVEKFLISSGSVKGVKCSNGTSFMSPYIILATGHSSRDIYRMLLNAGYPPEQKSFAMGIRVEHPQELIDKIQYHGAGRGKYLPAATYSLNVQVEGRGVYSFCMCPGGYIVPSATSSEELVVNGMSTSRRDSPFANSGIVVEVRPEDIPAEYSDEGSLAGMAWQGALERRAWQEGEESQKAPAQRLSDFISGRSSGNLPSTSYFSGIVSSPLHEWLPPFMSERLREGFKQFDRRMRGFITNEAVITAMESRTSSPVRILRDTSTLEHSNLKGLYPAGEGSGYAGGILSSSIDGIRVAKAISVRLVSV